MAIVEKQKDIMNKLWTYNDGGRAQAGYKGTTGDCVTRAIAICTGIPYQTIYDDINDFAKMERPRNGNSRSSSREGVMKETSRRYICEKLGLVWKACMGIGTGCKVHLKADELPDGRIIVKLSKHLCAVIDGVMNDLSDCSRNGTRCVYGYWSKAL